MASSHSTAKSSIAEKVAARVAMIDLEDPAFFLLQDCFRFYGIQAVAVSGDVIERLKKEKFDACVLELKSGAERTLEAARSSALNCRMVIYGVARSGVEARPFTRYGLNTILQWPLERQSVIRAIRATQALIMHEFRRYVRVPISTEVDVQVNGRRIIALSEEISAGGMSIRSAQALPETSPVVLSFVLPVGQQVTVTASPCWKRRDPENLTGLRFGPGDQRRLQVKSWIDEYVATA